MGKRTALIDTFRRFIIDEAQAQDVRSSSSGDLSFGPYVHGRVKPSGDHHGDIKSLKLLVDKATEVAQASSADADDALDEIMAILDDMFMILQGMG